MCYILVKNVNKRERNWQNRVKRNARLSGKICSHIINNMAENNKDETITKTGNRLQDICPPRELPVMIEP